MKKFIFRFSIFIFLTFFAGCNSSQKSSSSNDLCDVSVLNWNIQTFFDGNFDGNEYRDFKSDKSGWNIDKYNIRLNRLCAVIKKMDCDVVVMQELEEEGQLYDISNLLAGEFNSAKTYKYAFFAKDEKSSIGCGILSRLPLKDISIHELDIRIEKSLQPSMRPIIKCKIYKDDKDFTLFVNHWKSKAGGQEKSEIWRNYQEEQLSALVENALSNDEKNILMCGDFNKDILEFKKITPENKKNILLKGKNIPVYSPWFDENDELLPIGSYYYKDDWERIDNFFAAGDIQIEDFKVQNEGEWADENGHPNRYKIYTGGGYSDHLPITCTVRF